MRQRYFNRLDGMRAVSILLVLTIHSHVKELYPLHGGTGVMVFFVISGFLITTLLLREEAKHGSINLGAFYVRRAFRILPLYYVALGLTTLGVVLGLGENPGDYGRRLIYFLTYMNEFAPSGTFAHGWSLAIEEKYYLIWPALAFLIPWTVKHRGWVGGGVLAAASLLGLFLPGSYVGMYAPILAGCVLAITMNNSRGFKFASVMSKPTLGLLALGLVVLSIAFARQDLYSHVQVWVGLAVALAFPVLLIGPRWIGGWLESRWLMRVGTRAYAIYLFHPLVGSALDVVIPVDRGLVFQIVHIILVAVASFVLAELLSRFFEEPLIRIGKRISSNLEAKKASRTAGPTAEAKSPAGVN